MGGQTEVSESELYIDIDLYLADTFEKTHSTSNSSHISQQYQSIYPQKLKITQFSCTVVMYCSHGHMWSIVISPEIQ